MSKDFNINTVFRSLVNGNDEGKEYFGFDEGEIPPPEAFQSEYSTGIVNIIDKVTGLPGKMQEAASKVNDEIIRISREGSKVAEKNVKQTRVRSIGSNVAESLQSGRKWLFALGGIALTVILIRRL